MNRVTLNDKIELIYEFNKRSPLFAKVASAHVKQGEYELALEILKDGLEFFPNYPTALITYAIASANLGNRDTAYEYLTKACSLYNSHNAYEHYANEIDSILKSLGIISKPFKKGFRSNELNIEELAKKIEGAKIPKVDPNSPLEPLAIEEQDSKIISATMADILYKQGNLIEALAMYEEMLGKEPEKEMALKAKINIINKKLSE